MPEREGDLVRRVSLAAASVAAASAVALGGAAAAQAAPADLGEVATVADSGSALAIALNRVATEDGTVSPTGIFNR